MRVLLVFPVFPESFWSFRYALPFIGKKAAYPPLGLLTVAAMLPSSWQLRLVDTNVEDLTDDALAWADYVFLSAMGIQRQSADDIVARCRLAKVPVVAGGPLFTAEAESYQQIDHLVLGEAEVSLGEFLADLELGRARHVYRATGYADLHTSPVPRWDLVRLSAYSTMSVQYSRGCPYDCEFCDVTALFGRHTRTKTPAQITAELDVLQRLGWRGGVFFVDDNLVGDKRRLKVELLPVLIERQRHSSGLDFNTQISINVADDPELIDMMVAAGFESIFIGIETPDERALAECNKRHNLGRDLVRDVQRLQSAGLNVQAGFIVGFDHDTLESFDRLRDFIQSSGIATAMVGLLQAIPGTRLYARLKEANRLTSEGSGYAVNGSTNIETLIAPSLLRSRYLELIGQLYSPDLYYARLQRFLRSYHLPKVRVHWDLQYQVRELRALCSASIRLGVLERERTEYWRLLGWTILHNTWAFPLAVTLAIYGYHFRKSYESCLERSAAP